MLISIIGVLVLTPSAYPDCKDPYPDEFLDLPVVCGFLILPVFAPRRNAHPFLFHYFWNISDSLRANLYAGILRC